MRVRWIVPLALIGSVGHAEPGPPAGVAGVLQGFSFSWNARPHRLRSLGFDVNLAHVGEGDVEGALTAQVLGGSWASGRWASDTPAVQVDYAGFESSHRAVITGSVVLTVTGRSVANDDHRQRAAATVQIHGELPPGVEAAGVFLSGFQIDADPTHPSGFTVQELAVRLGEPTVSGREVTVDADAAVVASGVADRAQALQRYGATIRIDYVIVPSSVRGVVRLPVSSQLSHAALDSKDRVEEREASVRFAAPVPSDARVALAGLSGFQVSLEGSGYLSGRYLRSLETRLQEVRLDPFRQSVTGLVSMRFSNIGIMTRPIEGAMAADVTLLLLEPGERSWSGEWNTVLDGAQAAVRYPEELVCEPQP